MFDRIDEKQEINSLVEKHLKHAAYLQYKIDRAKEEIEILTVRLREERSKVGNLRREKHLLNKHSSRYVAVMKQAAEEGEVAMDSQDTADYLCIAPSTLSKMCMRKEIKYSKVDGYNIFMKKDIDEYLEAHAVQPLNETT